VTQILLRVSSDPDVDVDLVAVIEINKEEQKLIASREMLFEQAKNSEDEHELYGMSYWHYGCHYGDTATVLEGLSVDLKEAFDSEEFLVLPSEINGVALVEKNSERTETDRMQCEAGGIRWLCYLKHTDTELRTALIPYNTIRELKL